ncbi:MAG: 5'-methylthioadenosine/S-adenosylhomocysteine nucleosidase [Actinophytocola sp.]|uniref:5'-methylthioadenosine/S-adenosylhomocysteine nucleosidase family protein n=1 Tax=Actinophytocola sp. TaxID=1872138 RepID=UPI003C72C758
MIVILTALQQEHKAVRQHLTDVRTHRHSAGTLFEVGVLAGHPDRRVGLAVTGEGNARAATITERAINEFRPAAVLFVGIAGGLHDWLGLGDVVVATRVYGYHGGSSREEGFKARPRAWDSSHELDQVARHVDRTDTWRSAISGAPGVHFCPIAAGEVLLESVASDVTKQLDEHYNDAVAVEMESAGVAQASHLNLSTPAITIRGISDHADRTKRFTDQQGVPRLAAEHAAAFAAAVIAEIVDTDEEADHDGKGGKEERQFHIKNEAKGNAKVIAQIGVVHGGVQFGTPAGEGGS